ncbi:MAG: hypothetical protein AUI14_06760 [Actinobacteria bacterium 13_2_20CM_2_71_6]|nr:MAG: hypothetical protein AUI14_06760 [Actinobacteria bacterium 13_2_20CM_2_71_6]
MRMLRLTLALLAGGLVALALPAPASAHAYLATSAPADGAILDRAPELLVLSFTEHVELSATHLDIVDADGRHWAPTSVAVRPHNAAAGDTGTETPVDVVAGLPTLPANVYHVAWRTLSSDDLHVTSGTLVIGVQREVGAAAVPPGPGGPGIREAVLRGITLLGFCLLVGGAALALLLAALTRRSADRPGEDRRGADRPVLRRRLLGVAASGGALAVLAVPRGVRRGVIGLGAVAAVVCAIGTAVLGHPGGPLTALVGGVHVLAAGAWAGSVLVMALSLRAEPEGVRPLLRAFAVVAGGCLALLTVTGLLMVGTQVATVDALLTTPYGLLLLGKVAGVGIAGLLGLRTYRRLRRDVLPRRGILTEALVFGVVLALAGALAAAGPARGPRFPTNLHVATEPEVSGQAADLVDTVQIRPNRPGRNVVTITVADTRRPAPAPVTGVSVQLVGPDGTRRVHPVTRTAEGWTVSVDDIRTPGDWKVSVTIMRQGLAPVTDGHAWVVATAGQNGAGAVVSSAPLQPAVGWLAALAALAAVVGALILGYRWRRRRPSTVESPADPADPVEEAEEELAAVGSGGAG